MAQEDEGGYCAPEPTTCEPSPAAPAAAPVAPAPEAVAQAGQEAGGASTPYGGMFDGPAAPVAAAGMASVPPPELGPGNLEMPEGIGQEYTVNPEIEDLAAKVARGEMTAEEAQAAAQGGRAVQAAEAAPGLLDKIGGGIMAAGSALVDFLPPVPTKLLQSWRGGGVEEA